MGRCKYTNIYTLLTLVDFNTYLITSLSSLYEKIISHNEALGRINYGFSGMDWAYLTGRKLPFLFLHGCSYDA